MKARVPAEVQLEFPLPPEEEPVRASFAGDLYVTYALELADEAATLGRRYEHVARRHCTELGVAEGDLRRLATINLRNRRPDLSLSWYPDVRAVTVTLGDAGPRPTPGSAGGSGRSRRGGLEAGLLLEEGFPEKPAQGRAGALGLGAAARGGFVASGPGPPRGRDRPRCAPC